MAGIRQFETVKLAKETKKDIESETTEFTNLQLMRAKRVIYKL